MKKPYKRKKGSGKAKLILIMSTIVLLLFYVSFMSFWLVYMFFYKVPFIDIENLPKHTNLYIYCAISLILGFILAMIFRSYVLIPLHNSYVEIEKMAEGNFDININEKGIKPIRKLVKCVNTTANELKNVESMRSDFINNFSHEFKTPIISISGFAKMLKNENLTAAERADYLDIIISESERLTQLSTNVLNLTKLDNQSILTDISRFNVTEQIRTVIILLEQKWASKSLEIDFECDEYYINANEELLQQLWINLLDNAVKFSPVGSKVSIEIEAKKNMLVFEVSDSGKGMSELETRHAFEKFFQGDISHKSTGNGIGLAIAKKICELHKGSIGIKSTDSTGTTFEVILPYEK